MLSLPIAVSEAYASTKHTPRSQVGQGAGIRSPEHRALAANAFDAGAIGCREVVFKSAPAATGAVSSRHRRLAGVRGNSRGRGHSGRAPCRRTSKEDRQGFRERSEVVGGCGGDHHCRGGDDSNGSCRSDADGHTDKSLEERTVLVAESPGQLGIGGKVWDSAFVLCDYLAKAPASATFAAAAASAATVAADAAAAAVVGATTTARPQSISPVASPPIATGSNDDEMTCLASVEGGRALGAAGGGHVNDQAKQKSLRLEESGRRQGASLTACSASGSDHREDDAEEGGAVAESAATSADPQLRGTQFARRIIEGRRVLELGAGTGLVSVCCALLGASAVVATDFDVRFELQAVVAGGCAAFSSGPVKCAFALFICL